MYYMDTGYKTVVAGDTVTVSCYPPAPSWCGIKIHWQDNSFTFSFAEYGKRNKFSHIYTEAGSYAPRIEFLPNYEVNWHANYQLRQKKPGVDCVF